MPQALIIAVVIALLNPISRHNVEGGFTEGAPCSSRNTAYLNPSKALFPSDPVKCVDITGMGKSLVFHEQWPIQQADTLYADHMDLTRINRTIFTFMPNLELVDFTGNRIRRIPMYISGIIPKLTTFLLAKNRVRLPKQRPLMKSNTVKTLMLSHNKIRALQTMTFTKLPSLRVLYLDSNYLQFITPIMFRSLINLRYLHLGNNLLKQVPSKSLMPNSLSVYIVKGNKLERKKKIKSQIN
ncbi:leucine-rich repeat-containing protein 15-like [Tribolium madens]|uniref:leucine-rich repeat-containing protein 15-like n=1 Tax=Tribolium madens TaxID=41895 RepID=UPI001CF73216|nr:leucine-rich repeat-containing protein 15-like [Tribolium madens]